MFPSRRATLGGDVFRDEFSVSFDGTDEFIETTLNGSTFDGNFTISAWIKNVRNDAYRTIFGHFVDENNFFSLHLIRSSAASADKMSMQMNVGGTEKFVTSSTNFFTEDKWFHVVFTQDDDNNAQALYVDGVRDATQTHNVNFDMDGTSFIGRKSESSDFIYTGSISEVTIYNKSLSASEVKTIYNGREPYNHKEGVCYNNLVAWYRMGDGVLDRFGITGDTNFQNGVITDVLNAKLGNDLVTNGDFSNWTGDNPDNWTVNNETSDNTISQSGNAVRMVFTTGALLEITQSILTVDKIYKVTIDCTVFDSGSGFRVQSGNDSANRPVNIKSTSGLGTFVGYFKASHSNLRIIRNDATDVTFTNVTCREVLGNTGIVRNMTPTNIIGNTP